MAFFSVINTQTLKNTCRGGSLVVTSTFKEWCLFAAAREDSGKEDRYEIRS